MPHITAIEDEHDCDCPTQPVPGAIWPMASNGDESAPFVERCDSCERFETDDDAAAAIAAHVGGLLVLAPRSSYLERGWVHQPAVYPWPKEAR